MPNFFSTSSRERPPICVVSLPSMKILPASGRKIPSTDLIVTDLPVPEPPMMTTLSPLPIFRSTPSSTTFWPNRFLTPCNSIFVSIAPSVRKQDGGEKVVGGEDENGG